QEVEPLASAWFTCCAALARAAAGWLLPSRTDTIMVPMICETFGYVASWGLACLTFPRLEMKVSTPGSAASIFCANPGESCTDCRIGRSPVCREKYVDCAVSVNQSRNF